MNITLFVNKQALGGLHFLYQSAHKAEKRDCSGAFNFSSCECADFLQPQETVIDIVHILQHETEKTEKAQSWNAFSQKASKGSAKLKGFMSTQKKDSIFRTADNGKVRDGMHFIHVLLFSTCAIQRSHLHFEL